MINQDEIIFAVPKKGRLYEKVMKILSGINLSYVRASRQDIAYCDDFEIPMKIVFLPAKDIAQFVGEGNVDIGITGQDMVKEAQVEVEQLLSTGFGKCRLAVQAPVKENITDAKALVGKRIVTSFPNITKAYFDSIDESADKTTSIKYVTGSVEAACGLGLADAVVDLVETGTTMRAAGLEIVETIMSTETVLISNKASKHTAQIERIRKRIEGYLFAQKYMMIYYNVERSKHDDVLKITPGRKAPTITPLDNPDFMSVGAMVMTKEVSKVMDDLEAVGATDIFVVDIVNCRA